MVYVKVWLEDTDRQILDQLADRHGSASEALRQAIRHELWRTNERAAE